MKEVTESRDDLNGDNEIANESRLMQDEFDLLKEVEEG